MKNLLLGLLATSLVAVSCKKDEKPTYLKDDAGTQPAAMNTPKASLIDQAGITSNVQTGSTMVTSSGMNPPHGQPGHRCDIPVGQPLNGASAPANTQNIQVNGNTPIQIDPNSMNPGTVTTTSTAAPQKTAPGMNPPHGQPGHRCDIPVGQPLNSKPAAQPTPQNVQVQAPQPTPTPQPAVANTGPKPKLNPAHGEPWHDCAKQVGAPL